MKNIVIVGAGGFGTEAIWVLEEMNRLSSESEQWNIIGYADDNKSKKNLMFYGYSVIGTPEEISERYDGGEIWFFCAIGNNTIRNNVVTRLEKFGWKAACLIHPSVIFARNVSIGEGSYIGAGSILCPNAFVGKHVIINIRVTIGHDAVLEDYSQLCPGAQINGACRVCCGALIGSNASVLPGKEIGAQAIVGANSQVIRSVKAGETVNGVPAMILK
ncbi:MAG: acetyltransferase [Chlorobiaceae bacterium]|nr:acetyltransferase [Chlorobiaceae bacterium]